MRILHRYRPSPAMVVASIALLVALGGTSIAAVSVTLPRNSVGTPQLKNNAVTSVKVANRGLKAVDFARGQIPKGPRGLQGPKGDKGDKGDAGVAAPGYVAQVVSQTSISSSTTSSQSFQDVSGATQDVTVPAGETGRLYVWFSAESYCAGGTGNCSVRITVDGNSILPASGTDFFFDSTDAGDEGTASAEAHAIVRVSDTLNAGTHTVKVQFRTSQAATSFRLDDWALVIERTKVS